MKRNRPMHYAVPVPQSPTQHEPACLRGWSLQQQGKYVEKTTSEEFVTCKDCAAHLAECERYIIECGGGR